MTRLWRVTSRRFDFFWERSCSPSRGGIAVRHHTDGPHHTGTSAMVSPEGFAITCLTVCARLAGNADLITRSPPATVHLLADRPDLSTSSPAGLINAAGYLPNHVGQACGSMIARIRSCNSVIIALVAARCAGSDRMRTQFLKPRTATSVAGVRRHH